MEELPKTGAGAACGPAPCRPSPQKAGWRETLRQIFGPSQEKECRKLRSHVNVLRARAERLYNPQGADSAAHCEVRGLLDQKDWCKSDLAAMHDYADKLEELLPYIADESYLRTVLAYELTRTDETVTLTTLLPEAELDELRHLSGSGPPLRGPGGPDGGDDDGKRMAEGLSLLARERDGLLRHERLMNELRPKYLVFFTALIAGLLLMISLAIGLGVNADLTTADPWAQLLLVLSSGALGSILAAASRLKNQLDLVSFRAAARLIYIQPLIGATFGLTSWLILTAGVVTIGSGSSTPWATQAAVAFASGFSEPFALGILGRVTPESPPAPESRQSPR
jgi:hypothetical protein